MAWLVLVLVVVGLAVLLAWPALRDRSGARRPQDQPVATDPTVRPPRDPEEPIPGSRPHRRRHAKP
jgi:hypothetical protein